MLPRTGGWVVEEEGGRKLESVRVWCACWRGCGWRENNRFVVQQDFAADLFSFHRVLHISVSPTMETLRRRGKSRLQQYGGGSASPHQSFAATNSGRDPELCVGFVYAGILLLCNFIHPSWSPSTESTYRHDFPMKASDDERARERPLSTERDKRTTSGRSRE